MYPGLLLKDQCKALHKFSWGLAILLLAILYFSPISFNGDASKQMQADTSKVSFRQLGRPLCLFLKAFPIFLWANSLHKLVRISPGGIVGFNNSFQFFFKFARLLTNVREGGCHITNFGLGPRDLDLDNLGSKIAIDIF